MPLSLLYQLRLAGYAELLSRIKSLYEEDRVELTSCGAYHPLLTKLPDNLLEKELILNDYALGYYFGKNKGFEGEDALMLKNVNGVFPPEMAVSQHVLEKLDGMGYQWVIADEVCLPQGMLVKDAAVYSVADLDIKLVVRNTALSNMLSFKRDTDINDLVNEVLRLRQDKNEVVLCLDGEYFGHHYKEGIYVLNTLVEKLSSAGINFVTVSELIEKGAWGVVEEISESSWGATEKDMLSGNLYPMWEAKGNQVQTYLWELFSLITDVGDADLVYKVNQKDDDKTLFETFPIWDFASLENLHDITLKNRLYKNILLLQNLNSDQFWWASNIEIGGKVMYNSAYINKVLDQYEKYSLVSEDTDLVQKVADISAKIRALI